jgi:hypothetical protein
MSKSNNWYGEVVFGLCYFFGFVATSIYATLFVYNISDGVWGLSRLFYPLLDFDPKAKSTVIDIAKNGLIWSVPLLLSSCLGLNSIEIVKRLDR